MNKTVIANWGHSQAGKSETIKNIARLFIENYKNSIIDPPNAFDNIDGVDIKVIITIGSIKIGIESQGDPNSRLIPSLTEFRIKNCDIIICATRTSGETKNAVYELNTKYNYDVIWVNNYRSFKKYQHVLNYISANHIFDLIKIIITGKIENYGTEDSI